ncbi:flagellar hook-length control protein FliK [Kosakonia sp. H02]|nr:flagellar hook-length control protein FliK [Kosakonia sp. H02]
MIIRHSIPAATSDAGRQTASTSSAQEEGQFSSELKKQMSSGQTQKAEESLAPQEKPKKPADKKEEPADATTQVAATPLPADPLADLAKTLVMPTDVTTADALLAQGIQTAQPGVAELAALPQVTTDPALAAAPANGLPTSALPVAAQGVDPLTQASFAAVLNNDKEVTPATATKEGATDGVKFQTATAAAPLADKTVSGTQSPLPASDAATLTANAQTAPVSESFTNALHTLKAAEPVVTPNGVAQAAPVTAAATTPVVSTPAMATATLQAEVGTPAWQQSLGQQIAVFTRNGVHHAELHLHPEDLGALQVSLRVNNDQAQVHFVAESHQVRAALESALPNLRTMLQESGIELGQSSVGADTSSSAGDTQSGNASGQGKSDNAHGEGTISAEEARPTLTRVMHYSRGINTFA